MQTGPATLETARDSAAVAGTRSVGGTAGERSRWGPAASRRVTPPDAGLSGVVEQGHQLVSVTV
ncbi:MAG: hypothetical protein VX265_08620, partial [Myxococcota bacterium]|nr:hypothetical protein [Myxococcota bacterium]